MRRYAPKVAAVGFLIFLGLWIVGIIRGIALPYPPPPPLALASEREYFTSTFNTIANNLKQIALGAANYESANQTFPIGRMCNLGFGSGGSGYTAAPTVTFAPPPAATAPHSCKETARD